jgi:hypothetical protein
MQWPAESQKRALLALVSVHLARPCEMVWSMLRAISACSMASQ